MTDKISDPKHSVETKEPGCFDFFTKKGGKVEHSVAMEEPPKENKEDLRRLHSQSSSPSDEELEGERKKNKKSSEDDDNTQDAKDIHVIDVDEKKGFMENIKAHLPCEQKKTEEGVSTPEIMNETDGKQAHSTENGMKEKKGILEKIKEKLHKNDDGGELEEHKKEN